jgi:hypothetical protein
MGNFITDTLGKLAGNVTQSVASALIVTAITTYLIVSPGKNDKTQGSGADSAKTNPTVTPAVRSGAAREYGRSAQTSAETTSHLQPDASKSVNPGGGTKAVAVPATELKTNQERTVSPATEAATKAYKELPPENPTEEKLERTVTEGRAKGDSLLKAHPQDDKAKEANKEPKKETKDVKKRADEVFDELDQEVQKKPE